MAVRLIRLRCSLRTLGVRARLETCLGHALGVIAVSTTRSNCGRDSENCFELVLAEKSG
jgi:hypothetical protein